MLVSGLMAWVTLELRPRELNLLLDLTGLTAIPITDNGENLLSASLCKPRTVP